MTDCSFILEPLAVSELTSLANLPSLNYTNQDFYSMKTRLVTYIQEQFINDFADFVEGDLGIMLIENWAFLADTLSFKIDQIVNELFIDTVVELENAFRMSKLIGFMPTPPIAASAMFSATIQSPLPTDIVIPSGMRFDLATSGTPLSYELFAADANNNPIFNQDIVIPAGDITNTSIVGLEGQTVINSFTSNGAINQTYTLTTVPVLFDSVSVTVDGQTWNLVDFFSDSKNRPEYRVEFDSLWTGYVMFGNGAAGRVPSLGSQIQVTYRTGGGTRGNVITGFITGQRGVDVPGFNFSVAVTFRNYTKGDFGYDGDTIDDIRRKLPRFAKTQDRAVTGEDYKTLGDQFVSPYNGQIGKSLAALRNYGCAGNIVDLYVLAKVGTNGLEEASDQLKAELGAYMEQKKMMTDFLCIRDGVIVLVDVIIDVTVDRFFRKFQDEIEAKIKTRINDFFVLSSWEYGQPLRDTDVIRSMSDIREIKTMDVTFTTSDPNNGGSIVSTKYFEIIRNDNVVINLMFE